MAHISARVPTKRTCTPSPSKLQRLQRPPAKPGARASERLRLQSGTTPETEHASRHNVRCPEGDARAAPPEPPNANEPVLGCLACIKSTAHPRHDLCPSYALKVEATQIAMVAPPRTPLSTRRQPVWRHPPVLVGSLHRCYYYLNYRPFLEL